MSAQSVKAAIHVADGGGIPSGLFVLTFLMVGLHASGWLLQELEIWLATAALLGTGAVTLFAISPRQRSLKVAMPVPALGAPERAALDVACVVIRTPDGIIRHWSGGAERLLGYPASEAIGARAHELLGTRFPTGGRRAAMAELQQTGEWHGELRHRRRDGGVVTVATSWALRSAPEAGEPLVVEASTVATALKAAEQEVRLYEGRLRLAQEVAGVGTWEWNADSDEQDWSREQHALFGTDPDAGQPQTLESLLALVHPEDQPALRAAMARGSETGEYEAEFRIRRRGRDGHEEIRWLIGRGRRMPGLAGRLGSMLGVHVDITVRKEAEQRQALLIREVDHRAKNALAVVQAVLRLTRAPDQASYVRAVEGRVAALARAQTLLTQTGWSGANLSALLEGELAPFLVGSVFGPTVALAGPQVMLAPLIAQPLAMAVHELATNAVKHGALSLPGGRVEVAWSVDEDGPRRLRLTWTERGGPPLGGPPSRAGFGSRVLRATLEDQVGGRLEQVWEAGGVVCRLEVPLAAVVAGRSMTEGQECR